MNFLENKITQFIALVGIIGTLAGFGYTGATYVNRIDNLEAKIGGVKEADEGLGAIELRIEALETSIEFLNAGLLQSDDEANERISRLDKMSEAVSDIKSDIATLNAEVKNLKEDTEGNPLSG
jgi:chromosome segregation ATPase